VNNNGRDGIHLEGPFTRTNGSNTTQFAGANHNTLVGNHGTGNGSFDGFDGNPNCDHNDWRNNMFGTVNQRCVAANGGTGTVPPGTVAPVA
jgi:hypothetical protein